MTVTIPPGLRPVATGTPRREPVKLTKPEMYDLPWDRRDGPRSYGSQLRPWIGGVR